MSKLVNRRQANHRAGEEWYTCERCGFQYPRSSIIVQNGLIVCTGINTTQCLDLPGHGAELTRIAIPLETPLQPLPAVTEDL